MESIEKGFCISMAERFKLNGKTPAIVCWFLATCLSAIVALSGYIAKLNAENMKLLAESVAVQSRLETTLNKEFERVHSEHAQMDRDLDMTTSLLLDQETASRRNQEAIISRIKKLQ